MARITIPSAELTIDRLKKEIDRLTGSEETRNISFINAICQEFQTMAVNYYKAGATPKDRLRRLDEIRHALSEIGFKDRRHTYSIGICPGGGRSVQGLCG